MLATLLLFAAPVATVDAQLGVCFHVNVSPATEFPKMRATGFTTVRTDLPWAEIEGKPGQYSWKKFDGVVDRLRAAGLRPLMILNGPNPAYGPNSPSTAENRAAFVRFATLAARRYGTDVDYEIWNEPYHKAFWKPAPNARDYVLLAKATASAIRSVQPKARILGLSGDPFVPFTEECFKLGLLDSLDAVSIHPYRYQRPESLVGDMTRFRALMAKYAPNRNLDIEITEMGYPISYPGQDLARQASYLQRAFLLSLVAGVKGFYIYEWKNQDIPGAGQHGFGLYDDRLQPMPVGTAFTKLAAALKGYSFEKRVPGASEDYVLSFVKGSDRKYVAWTARRDPADGAAVGRNPGRIALAKTPQASVAGKARSLSDVPQIISTP